MKITVVIIDMTNWIHMQEPVQHRSVTIELNDEQLKKLTLKDNEEYSLTFIEKEATDDNI